MSTQPRGADASTEVTAQPIDCGFLGPEKVLPRVHEAMAGAEITLQERGIPARALGQGASEPGIDIGLAERAGLAVRVERSGRGLALRATPAANALGRVAALESRETYEAERTAQQAQLDAAHEEAMRSHAEALRSWEDACRRHEQVVAEERRKWDAGAAVRAAARRSKQTTLTLTGIGAIVGGVVLAVAIWGVWDISRFYERVGESYFGFLVLRLLVMLLPPIVLLAPVALGIFVWARLQGAALALQEPGFAPSPGPRRPKEPALQRLAPEGPFDVLDSLDKVRAFAIDLVTSATVEATKVKVVSKKKKLGG